MCSRFSERACLIEYAGAGEAAQLSKAELRSRPESRVESVTRGRRGLSPDTVTDSCTHTHTHLQAWVHNSDTYKGFLSERHSPSATAPSQSSEVQKNRRICVSTGDRRGASAFLHGLGPHCYTAGLCLSPLGTTARSLGSCDSPLVLLPDYKAVSWL